MTKREGRFVKVKGSVPQDDLSDNWIEVRRSFVKGLGREDRLISMGVGVVIVWPRADGCDGSHGTEGN